MNKPNLLSICFVLIVFLGTPLGAFAQKFVGGDISLLARYEEHGAKYLDKDGNPCGEMLSFFKREGMTAMRVRLFVNPENATADEKGQGVFQDLDYVKKLGKRIKDTGLSFLLDLHYSDSWADPGKQRVPKAWEGLSDADLATKVYEYTKDCLQQLKDCGAEPDQVQIGNEVSYGMLFGVWQGSKTTYYAGKEANRDRFTAFLKSGARACREVCPQSKIVVHIERVETPDYIVNFFNDMAAAQLDYDIIGLSYYPVFHGVLPQLRSALDKIRENFPGREVFIVETGYSYAWPREGDYTNKCKQLWPVSDNSAAGQAQFAEDLIATLADYDFVKGLYWWQMDSNEYWLDWSTNRVLDGWWNESLFDNRTGRATEALYKLKDFDKSSAIAAPCADRNATHDGAIYNLAGQRVNRQAPGYIYIKEGKKVVR